MSNVYRLKDIWGCEVDSLRLSNAQIKNMWSYISILHYVLSYLNTGATLAFSLLLDLIGYSFQTFECACETLFLV